MGRYIKYFLGIFLFAVFVYILGGIYVKNNINNRLEFISNVLKLKIHFLLDSRKNISSSSLVFIFEPDCEYCNIEIDKFCQRRSLFKDTSILLLTSSDIGQTNEFIQKYKLNAFPNIRVGIVSQLDLYNAFGPTSVPHIFIYGPDGRLRKEFRGETKIEAILKYL